MPWAVHQRYSQTGRWPTKRTKQEMRNGTFYSIEKRDTLANKNWPGKMWYKNFNWCPTEDRCERVSVHCRTLVSRTKKKKKKEGGNWKTTNLPPGSQASTAMWKYSYGEGCVHLQKVSVQVTGKMMFWKAVQFSGPWTMQVLQLYSWHRIGGRRNLPHFLGSVAFHDDEFGVFWCKGQVWPTSAKLVVL